MSKRILALVCLLAMLIGVLAFGVSAASEQDGYYDVGYAKVDVNPWVQSNYTTLGIPATQSDGTAYTDAATMICNTTINNPNNTNETVADQPLVRVKLSGYGTISERRADSVSDDNGDGLVLPGQDGLQLTCTSVTDDWGTTVMYITIDSIGGYENFTKAARNAIVAELGADVISANNIMVSGSHSHEGPDLGNCAGSAEGTALRAYYDYYVARAVEAAKQAYESRTPSTMTKGSIDAPTSMKSQGYTYSDGSGIKMNFVRHYNYVKTTTVTQYTRSGYWGDWTEGATTTTSTIQYSFGDNFGSTPSIPATTTSETSKTFTKKYTKTVTSYSIEHVNAANETMNVLKFTPNNGGKSTVLIQWQAHPSIMGSSSRYNISSDYINALRYRLENNYTKFSGDVDYNVGFWQGTGGNMNGTSRIASEYTFTPSDMSSSIGWIAISGVQGMKYSVDTAGGTSSDQNRLYRNSLYGYLVGQIALDCLDSEMTSALDMGKIHTIQSKYRAERQQDSAGLIAAAAAWRTDYDAGETITYPYTYTYNGTVYALNSYYHAYNVEQRAKSTATHTSLELNAILLGENVAMVTAPLELFDHYDANGSTEAEDNDWNELIGDSYGAPFILSKSNARAGYVPNTLAYNYYTDTTGNVTAGTEMGSYEANITVHAEGVGEKVVAKLAEMLELVQIGYVEAECPHCGDVVEWTPLTAESATVTTITSGHYYLSADMPRVAGTASQKSVGNGATLCINLNGHLMEAEGRSFNITSGGTVNLFNDTSFPHAGSTGIGRSYTGSNNAGGGYASIAAGGTFNLYGGTLEFVAEDTTETGYNGTGVGGIFSVTGTLNVYDGTIKGADLVDSKYVFGSDGTGAAMYIYGGGSVNLYGGTVTSGTLPTTNDLPTAGGTLKAKAPCIYVSATNSRVRLAGDADVDNIYLQYSNGNLVTVDGNYTGTTTLSAAFTITEGVDIGNIANNATFSNITSVSATDYAPATGYMVRACGPDVVLTKLGDDVVAVTGTTGYTTLQAAIDGYTGTLTNYAIKLRTDIQEDIVLSSGKTAVINLNGYDIKSVNVTSGKIMCMDAATDDYDVTDGMYGKILSASGNIIGYNTDGSRNSNGYMAVEENGALSFHAVNLKIFAMTLRPVENGVSTPSVYYQSNFMADHIAAAKIQKYGVAMSANGAPTLDNLETDCKMSSFENFQAGPDGNTGNGTLLKGIMKTTNANLVNRRNANLPVYGAAYVLTDDGYMLGYTQQKTLIQQAEDIDAKWDSLSNTQKVGMVKMYDTYTSIISKWSMTNLAEAIGPSQDGVLKVLVIGNSHGLDATNLLYEVFEDQGYDEQELILGALYYSGCNMTQHATFMSKGQAVYSYYENDGSNADGSWNVQENVVADVALEAHQWDIVVLQQMNHRAAYDSTESTFYNAADFKTVIDYVQAKQNGVPKFGWHMVWTNPDGEEYLGGDYSHPTDPGNWTATHAQWFPNAEGNFDQSVMYEKIVACTQEYIEGDESFLGSDVFDFVIPSATAVEYAQDVLGLTQAQVYRDYTHMNDYGRLIAAYTWYAKILELEQIPAVGIDAIPEVLHHSNSEYPTADSGYAVTDDMKKLIRNAVNYALDNPYELPSEEDNTVSILGIGNSYTIDSMWMLGEVYQAENPGKNVKLGIAYRSGETLSGHVTNISAGNTYHYLYWDSATDTWTVTAEQTLQQILKAQKWETVSMQQGSSGSGRATTYNGDIQTIQTYVKEQLGYTPTFTWNMTWAYPMEDIEDNYTLENAPNANSFTTYYQNSQAVMYKAIVDAVQTKILPDATFEYLMPVGTAIQNANATLTDFELYRDYTHLSDLSRLMAAYTWYCELELVTLDEIQLSALPTVNCSSSSWYNGAARDLTETEFQLVVDCVKAAMQDNFTTTDPYVYEE